MRVYVYVVCIYLCIPSMCYTEVLYVDAFIDIKRTTGTTTKKKN